MTVSYLENFDVVDTVSDLKRDQQEFPLFRFIYVH